MESDEMFAYYQDKFEWFAAVLGYFLDDTYYPERKDVDTIRRFVEECKDWQIEQAIKEGKEMLLLDPFPWEYISTAANGIGYEKSENKIYNKEELARRWVKRIVETLESEARKAGKLK